MPSCMRLESDHPSRLLLFHWLQVVVVASRRGCALKGGEAEPQGGDRKDERQRMVDEQLRGRGIRSPRVLDAMLDVPRHLFVPLAQRSAAYVDSPLPIGERQTISQPYIVA